MRPYFKKSVPVVLWLMLMLSACNQNVNQEPVIPFDHMTPAQHLEKAKSIMKSDNVLAIPQDQLKEAERHLSAIPKSAPESVEAIALERHAIEGAEDKVRERVRQNYTSELETSLREKGFDIVVTEVGDQLIVASDLLKDDSGRIQFLASIRKDRDAAGLCNMGFRRVTVSARSLLK